MKVRHRKHQALRALRLDVARREAQREAWRAQAVRELLSHQPRHDDKMDAIRYSIMPMLHHLVGLPRPIAAHASRDDRSSPRRLA